MDQDPGLSDAVGKTREVEGRNVYSAVAEALCWKLLVCKVGMLVAEVQ